MPKYLVIGVVGDRSHHSSWLKSKTGKFDLMLVYYGKAKEKYKEDADYYLQTSGMFKLENIAYAVKKHWGLLGTYDAVFLPDDDMIISAPSINLLFSTFSKHKLDLAQATIAAGSISHPIERTLPGYILRYSDFISMGCPVFSTPLLLDALPLFTLSRSGWGIDLLWSSKYRDKSMAMMDCVSLFHLQNQKGGMTKRSYYQSLKKLDIDAEAECQAIVDQFNLTRATKVLGGLRLSFPRFFLAQIKYFIRYPRTMIRHSSPWNRDRIRLFQNSEVVSNSKR